MGQVIGETYAGTKPPTAFDQPAKTAAVALLTGGDLVKAQGRPTGPAGLVLVVLGEDSEDTTAVEGPGRGPRRDHERPGRDGTHGLRGRDLETLRGQRLAGLVRVGRRHRDHHRQIAAPLALARQMSQQGGDFGASVSVAC